MVASRAEGGLPTRAEMLQWVEETILAAVDVRLVILDNEPIYVGQGRNAALEVNGDLDQLLP